MEISVTVSPKWVLSYVLRLLAVAANIASAFLMATSHGDAKSITVSFKAKYSNSPAFMYFVIANVIVAIYNIFIVFVPCHGRFQKLVVAADVVATMIQATSTSAAVAIAQVNKSGNYQSGWRPICCRVNNYCDHVTYALGAGFAGLALNLVVVFSSIHLIHDDCDDCDD